MMMLRIRAITGLIIAAVLICTMAGCGYIAPRSLSAGPAVKEGEIVFRFYSPSARRVQLAGNWPENNWARGDGSAGEANIGLMKDEDSDGIWEISVALPAGRYKYLFWVDENTWHLDPGVPEEVSGGPTGTCSQVILYSDSDRLEIR